MSEQSQMNVWEHVGELRKRVIYILLLFVLSMVLGFYLAPTVINYLKLQDVAQSIDWVVIGLTDAFRVYLQFAMALGIVITFPFALYQIWAFVSPGLTVKERRVTLSYIPGGILLFIIGLSFGYFWLFPFVVGFMMNIAEQLGAQEMYGMASYFSFLFTLIIPFGFLFQMPLLMLFLTRLGVVNPVLLRKIRKFAYFALFVIAAIITPPDLLSHLFVTLPLIILYEVSILLSHLSYKKMVRAQEEELSNER
ncbi:twin-arginine translocase subunit TatC [Caldalkalibacillus mannanilyticus]|uniref:twin-arginine translocase subunit TatC n=1 Tax=Caldalkalibacillus mannanilyticus TaxID=1418 RepID=UPI00046A4D9C|nr:twin-arginine translocase subunit TatC [Caldalkalibacillus mannanilyticus]